MRGGLLDGVRVAETVRLVGDHGIKEATEVFRPLLEGSVRLVFRLGLVLGGAIVLDERLVTSNNDGVMRFLAGYLGHVLRELAGYFNINRGLVAGITKVDNYLEAVGYSLDLGRLLLD